MENLGLSTLLDTSEVNFGYTDIQNYSNVWKTYWDLSVH